MSYTHLHVHTHYSILDGYATAEELFDLASEYKMPGLAITDHGTMAGVPDFLEQARLHPEVKPVIGCEFCTTDHYEHTQKDFEHRRYYHFVLLAKNLTGYYNLVKLCSLANVEGFYYKPRISHRLLKEHCEGLICLSGGLSGEVSYALNADEYMKTRDTAVWYREVFGNDFYLEVMLHPIDDVIGIEYDDQRAEREKCQRKTNECLFRLSEELGIKVVASNDVHFAKKEDGFAHDILTTFQLNAKIDDPHRHRYTYQEYLKSEDEMLSLFPEHPEAISASEEILGKVERFDIVSNDLDEFFLEQKLREEWAAWDGTADSFYEHLKIEYGSGSVAKVVNYRKLGEKEALTRVARAYGLDVFTLIESWGGGNLGLKEP